MGVGALVGGSIVSGLFGARSASKAADAQANAAEKAARTELQATRESIAEQRRQFDLGRSDLAPSRQAGYNALAAMSYELGIGPRPVFGEGGNVASAFGLSGDEAAAAMPGQGPQTQYGGFQASPGYQFRLDEGQKALERNAAARGLRLSSGTMKDALRYGQGMASDDYGNYYNRLAGLAGAGQTATNTGVQLGANTAGNIQNALMTGAQNRGNAYMAAGDARAGGALGVNNALQGTMGNLSSIWMMNKMGAFS